MVAPVQQHAPSTRLGEPRRVDPRRAPGRHRCRVGIVQRGRTHWEGRLPGSSVGGLILNPAKQTECRASCTTSGTTVSGGRSGCRDSHHVDRRCRTGGIAPDRSVYPPAVESSRSLSLRPGRSASRRAMGVLGRVAEAQLGEPLTAIEHVSPHCGPAAVRVRGRTRTRPRCDGHHHGWNAVRRWPVQQLRLPPRSRWSSACASGRGSGLVTAVSGMLTAGPHRVRTDQRSMHAIRSRRRRPSLDRCRRSTRTRTVQGDRTYTTAGPWFRRLSISTAGSGPSPHAMTRRWLLGPRRRT